MRCIQATTLAGLVVAALCTGACAGKKAAKCEPCPQVSSNPKADEQAVRKLALAFVETFNGKDDQPLEKLKSLFAESFVQAGSDGRLHQGKAANLKFYRGALQTISKFMSGYRWTYDIQHIQVLGDMGRVFGKITMSGTLKATGKPWSKEIWETQIFERQRNRWRLVLEHSSPVANP